MFLVINIHFISRHSVSPIVPLIKTVIGIYWHTTGKKPLRFGIKIFINCNYDYKYIIANYSVLKHNHKCGYSIPYNNQPKVILKP